MSVLTDQRSRARQLSFGHPWLTAMLVQIIFWVSLNTIMITVIQLTMNAVATLHPEVVLMPYGGQLLLATVAGILYGAVLGTIDYKMDKQRGTSLGRMILIKGVLYTLFFAVVMILVLLSFQHIFSAELKAAGIELTAQSRLAWMLTTFAYTVPGNFLISFINQVRRRFGPGIMIPLLLGRYRNPVVEHRIFMFMDLRSSTTYAEALGHLRYSRMIRDLFADVNRAVPKHDAEIYQYAGDEVIFTWSTEDGVRHNNCIELYFTVRNRIEQRRAKYLDRYDFVPEFKAGLHAGEVTAVEIGDIKRDIAYHGDTVNTAARIQSVCNDYGKDLIVSSDLLKLLSNTKDLKETSLGNVALKGKSSEVGIHAIDRH